MRVSHVIRGEDHLSNTPRQIMIYQVFGWEPPVFAHHPLILGPDRTPLSKRHGATAVSQYREDGFLPEALLNYLVLLGWTPPTGEEILPLERIVGDFSLQAISKSAPVHNLKKLEWLNSSYIRAEGDEELAGKLVPYLRKAGIPAEQIDQRQLVRMAGVLKDNLVILSDLTQYVGIFYDEKFSFDDTARSILLDPKNQETLRLILPIMEGLPELEQDDQHPLLSLLGEKTGRKGKALYAPLRAAVTGKTKGPELARTLPILGRDRIITRLKMALELS
jgi:nondiscriminating glutamyl-tRNA synthetase